MQPDDLYRLGIAVIPVLPRSKRPAVRWEPFQHRLPRYDELRHWQLRRETNWAAICGWQGLTVLDFDQVDDYLRWKAWAIVEGGPVRWVSLDTYQVKTARGIHVYVFVDRVTRCGHFSGGDIKAQGGYVLIPPSIHPSGAVYTARDPQAPILQVPTIEELLPDRPRFSSSPGDSPNVPLKYVYEASALWPKTVREEIRERVSLLELLPDAKPSGGSARWYITRCPFHDDELPSLRLDLQVGVCWCFAGCFEKALDVVGLYARLHGIETRQAIRELYEREITDRAESIGVRSESGVG